MSKRKKVRSSGSGSEYGRNTKEGVSLNPATSRTSSLSYTFGSSSGMESVKEYPGDGVTASTKPKSNAN